MKKILYWKDISSVKLIVQAVRNNELILATTDTILGLFASVNEQGKARLDSTKKRDKKPYIILLSEKKIKDIFTQSISVDTILYSVIKNFWPGPLTIIFDSCDILPEGLIDQETVAVRVPAHEGISRLLDRIDMVFSTSANLAGKPVPLAFDDIDPEIMEKVSYCVMDDLYETRGKLPSTIIRYDKRSVEKPIILVREGCITMDELMKVSDKLGYLRGTD